MVNLRNKNYTVLYIKKGGFHMKRFKHSRLQLLIIYLLIYIFIMTFVSYNNKQSTYDMISNRLYYDNGLKIKNPETINWNQMQFDKKNYGMYIELDQYSRVQMADTSKRNPPMIGGYYPQHSESIPKAVVGRNIYKYWVTEKNGKKWIRCLGQDFEVVGVVGTDYVSSCDELTILFGAKFNSHTEGKPVVMDAKDPKDLSAIADKITSKNPDIELQKNDLAGTARLTKNSYYFKLFYMETILLVGSAIILLGKLQWEKYRNRRKVYFMLGIPTKRVIIYQTVEIVALNIISFIISIILGQLINVFQVSMFIQILQISLIVTFFSCISIQMFLVMEKINLNKTQINLHKYLNKKGNHKC